MNANEATLLYVDEFSRMAEAYDRNVVPRFEAIAQEVLRLADPKAGELVLDIGTGTGLLACLVAPFVRPQGVVAIDLADGAISVASYRAGNAGIRNIRFEMLDSRNIVYHGKLFDAAVSNLGIPVFGWDRVFQEVHRVLKPGGRFIFSEWPTDNPTTFGVPRQLLAKYGTATPSKDLTLLREARQLARDDPEAAMLGNPAGVRKGLANGGFDRVVDLHGIVRLARAGTARDVGGAARWIPDGARGETRPSGGERRDRGHVVAQLLLGLPRIGRLVGKH